MGGGKASSGGPGIRLFGATLFGKLLASYVLVILVALISTTAVLSHLFTDYYISSKEAEIARKGQEIADLMTALSGPGLRVPDDIWLSAMDRFVGARLFVIDTRGIVIASTTNLAPRGSRLTAGEVGVPLGRRIIIARGFNNRFHETMLSAVVPVVIRGEIAGGLVLNAPVTGLAATIGSVRVMTVYAAGGSIVLAMIVGFFLSRSISRPLQEMSQATLEMAHGNFEQRVAVRSSDEIGQLASNVNFMAAALDRTVGDLAAEKSKIEGILSDMAEGVVAVDASGRVILTNECARIAMGFTEDPAGRALGEVAGAEPLADLAGSVLESGAPDVMEMAQGEKSIIARASPLAGRNGETTGAVIVLQDVTDLTRLERLRRELLADASHELRTPLSSIQGMSEALKDGVVRDAALRDQYVASIHEEAVRLARLVGDLLDVSWLQSGRAEWSVGPVDVGAVISRVAGRFAQVAAEQGVLLKAGVPAGLPQVSGNEGRIEQVVFNLLENAVKFTPRGGEIGITAGLEGESVRARVSDTGPGIPAADIPRIWERFYRVEKSRARATGGSGLGLAIVRQIVEAHGGAVSVESEPGRGAVFSFTLPVYRV